jgi:amino acid adenylation domain-containing protein
VSSPQSAAQAEYHSAMHKLESTGCLHDLIEAQVERTPNACAIDFKNRRYTYAELNRNANRLAHALIQLGVRPETRVAIVVERSPLLLFAMLAVLKSGAAFVVIDAKSPHERVAGLLDEARPTVLITESSTRGRLAANSWHILIIDKLATWENYAADNPLQTTVQPGNLAYMSFTSGSTGKPKGVLIEHEALFNHATAMAHHFALTASDRVLQFAAVNFDVAYEEIFPTWLTGAAVILWPVTVGVAPIRHFVDFVETQGISVLNLPAPYWHEWTTELGAVGIPQCVRLVIAGSDKVSRSKFLRWREHAGARVRLLIAYGVTEATITSTLFEPPEGFHSAAECMPIGKPIANCSAYVLDGDLQPLAAGETGELFLGGAGVARGYFDLPQMTAERFIANPFSPAAGERLYRTGDRARWLADGNLEFLGRADDQVKIRGYRIEIGEVENTLRQYPVVSSAAVAVHEDGGEKKLIAYVVMNQSTARFDGKQLAQFLRERLPEYMIPAAFVELSKLPLTATGKIDRRRLPAPRPTRANLPNAYVAPRSDLERELVRMWQRTLEIVPIGVTDNFFDLGGHSLQMARIIAAMEKKFALVVPMTTIYHTRTVEELARHIEARQTASGNHALVSSYSTDGTKTPIFCHGGSLELARRLSIDRPLYWLFPHGTDGQALPSTIEAMAQDYLAEVRRIQPRGPYNFLGYSVGGLVLFDLAHRLIELGESVAMLAMVDTWLPEISANAAQKSDETGMRALLVKLRADPLILPQLVNKIQLSRRVQRRFRRIARGAKLTLCEALLHSGYRLPPMARNFYFDETIEPIVARYVLPCYRGPLVVFRRPDNGTEAQWRQLTSGIVQIHDAWVDHNQFLEEPFVTILAQKVNDFLDSAARSRFDSAAQPAPQLDGRLGAAAHWSN